MNDSLNHLIDQKVILPFQKQSQDKFKAYWRGVRPVHYW